MAGDSGGAFRAMFIGPGGWRAAWRLMLFFAIVTVVALAAVVPIVLVSPQLPEVYQLVGSELLSTAAVLVAAWTMGRLERRSLAAYGLSVRRGALRRFSLGLAAGLAALTLLIGALAALGALRLTGLSTAGTLRWATLYAALFLLVGFFEEFFSRGYALFTLASGMGFWPSAALTSVLFGLTHLSNPGESPLGIFNAGLIGLVFCLMLRRTGDLWLAIGFHAAWDWGESYLYGVANSAVRTPGSLMVAAPAGRELISGGAVGPEGSALCTALIVGVGVAVSVLLREVRYPLGRATNARAPLPTQSRPP